MGGVSGPWTAGRVWRLPTPHPWRLVKVAAMFPCIIPAQPGFRVVAKPCGYVKHIPVIGWFMPDEHTVRAVTLDGVEPEDTPIVGPDGKQAYR